MRDRHLPRLRRSCRGPMARQEDTCWRCGARWAAEEQPGDPPPPAGPAGVTIAAGDIEDAPAPRASTPSAEGGTFAPDRAVAAARSGGRDERSAPAATAPGRRSTPKGHTPQCGDGAPRTCQRKAWSSSRKRARADASCWQRPIAGGSAPAIPLHRPPRPDRSRAPRRGDDTTGRPARRTAASCGRRQGNNHRIADGADLRPGRLSSWPRSWRSIAAKAASANRPRRRSWMLGHRARARGCGARCGPVRRWTFTRCDLTATAAPGARTDAASAGGC
jgi:hypothetical protein